MTKRSAFTLTDVPEAGRRRRAAFTLIELLVVVAIIALLVAILTPAMNHVRDLAKKAVCQGKIKAFGPAISFYVGGNQAYPHFGVAWDSGWPKFYGVLEKMGYPGSHVTHGLQSYEGLLPVEVPEAALCPAMDAAKIWDRAARASSHPEEKVDMHRAAIGYQWNVTLRCAEGATTVFPSGRYPPGPWKAGSGGASGWDNTIWIDYYTSLPDGAYLAQAVHPKEIDNPANCAEAWDGIDPESAPRLRFPGNYDIECLVPGWHVGPQSHYTGGRAVLNGSRHPHSPNILYADGSVRADATHKLTPAELGGLPGAFGSWADCRLNTWGDYDATFGTMHHIVPRAIITTGL